MRGETYDKALDDNRVQGLTAQEDGCFASKKHALGISNKKFSSRLSWHGLSGAYYTPHACNEKQKASSKLSVNLINKLNKHALPYFNTMQIPSIWLDIKASS